MSEMARDFVKFFFDILDMSRDLMWWHPFPRDRPCLA